MSTTVDDYFAHLGVEVDDEIKHYGVPGMKWGKRKNGTDVSEKKLAKMNRQADRGDARIAKAGSRRGAVGKVIGREIGTQILINVGAYGVNQLAKNNPSVRLGTSIVSNLAAIGSMAKSTSDIIDINQAEDRQNGS
jgi:hypothetical protein